MSPKTFITPPIHLCSPSPAVKFMIYAMLAELIPDDGEGYSDAFDTSHLPWKTATALFGSFDYSRIDQRVLAATFEDAPCCSACDLYSRYNVFSYISSGGLYKRDPDGGDGCDLTCFTFSQELLGRLQPDISDTDLYGNNPADLSIVGHTMHEVFNSDLVLAAVALEFAHNELNGAYKSMSPTDLKQRIREAETNLKKQNR